MVALALAALLFGCAGAPVAEPLPALDAFTGVLVTVVRTNWRPTDDARLQVHYTSLSRGTFASTRRLTVDAPNTLEIVVLPAGSYRVTRVAAGAEHVALSAPLVFKIEPNSLTYIGDLELAFMATDQLAFGVEDRQQELIQLLQKVRPDLLRSYPLVKRVMRDASSPR